MAEPAFVPANDDSSRTLRFKFVDGPWMHDEWVILDVPGERKRAGDDRDCPILGCGNPSFCGERLGHLCHGHYWRWRRDGEPAIDEWVSRGHKPIMQKEIERSRRAFDFTRLPQKAVEEIRFVVGHKFSRGEWTPNRLVRSSLELLANTLLEQGNESFVDREADEWLLLARRLSNENDSRWQKNTRPYLSTFFNTLDRALIENPWEEDVWLWRGVFESILGSNDSYSGNLRWIGISQPWLREAMKRYARVCLQTKTREWSTLLSWCRGLSRFSLFLRENGITEQHDVNRKNFLLFLEGTRAAASKHQLQEVNTIASILSELKLREYLPDLGSELFLRSNENVVPKVRSPRPWPKDVLHRIEQLIDDEEVDDQLRLMLRFCRWGGPRISELVALPLESLLENGKGGYWIEYFQQKSKTWRRFPIPNPLGLALVGQRRWVLERYGDTAQHMFPQPISSNPMTGTTRAWTTSGLGARFASLFEEHRITSSSLTGETISGAEVHRFRHTIGTELLNAGWSAAEVQAFLGHSSPTMTAAYASITDDTLSRKSQEFFEQASISDGGTGARTDTVVERLREKYTAVTGIGFCALPPSQHCSVRDNPCLSCAFFRTGDGQFDESRGTFRKQLKLTIASSRMSGSPDDEAVAQLNERILAKLDKVSPSKESS